MNDLTKQDTLELEVANFGPIVEAKIDLRPLTVFVGPSNTGKSYLATLIYALHRFFKAGPYPIMQPITNGSLDDLDLPDNEFNRLPDAEFDRILQALREWEAENHERNVALSAPVADDLVLPLLRHVDGLFKEVLADEITRCFGVDGTKDLIRHPGSNNAEIAPAKQRIRRRWQHGSV